MASTISANSSLCPKCGAGLRCGMVTGDAECWCCSMPPVIAVPAQDNPQKASCLCPGCLQQLIELTELEPQKDTSHDLRPATD